MSSLDDNLVPIAIACYLKVKTRKKEDLVQTMAA